MRYDIKEIPFSVFGAYLVVSYLKDYRQGDTLYLRAVHGEERLRPLFRIDLLAEGKPLPFFATAEPGLLTLQSDRSPARCEITYDGTDVVRMRAAGCEVRLLMEDCGAYHLAYAAGRGRYELNAYSHKLMATPLSGSLSLDAPWEIIRSTRIDLRFDGEIALHEYRNIWPGAAYDRPFDACARDQREAFEAFLSKQLAVPARYGAAREKAALLNWSACVRPEGHFTRPAMLMSKNWMTNVWTWDHCFNAMALAKANPDLSWDQFMLPFDHADASGALPDCINDMSILRNFVKPPIHGLTLRLLMESPCVTEQRLAEAYEPLARWTAWWFSHRDFDQDGIPQYNHGNDSGWDNSTAFKDAPTVEGPDLSAFLVLQLETLSLVAERLGRPLEAAAHLARAGGLLSKLLGHSAVNGRLRARQSGAHAVSDGDTLLDFLPLVLGERLPEDMRRGMIAAIRQEGRFLTAHGLATESVSSPYYVADGYWRGPIWAPSTWLMIQGLSACGEAALATRVARSFCDMCAKNGFAENFDAATGEALRDRAYTWTSSVFLLLAHDLYRQEAANHA